jgi:cell division protein FtsQ
MADQSRNSSQSRNSERVRRSGNIGRARQRQQQREKVGELRQTLGRSALQNLQAPSLKDVDLKAVGEKLAALNPSSRRTRRDARRAIAGQTSESQPLPASRRRPVRRTLPAQPVVTLPQRGATASPARSLSADRRQRHTINSSQGKMPPVLVRGRMPDMAARRTKQSLPRRRYDVALAVPGAELQLPSLPMVQVGWRALSGMLAVMMIACLFLLWKSPAFQVSTVEAEGLQRLSVADLNAVMDVLGNSIFSLDPPVLEQALSRYFPELADISVNIGLPAQVSIKVTERQPVLSWYQDAREVWVDAEGVAFTPRGNPGELVRVQGSGDAPEAIAGVVVPSAGSLPEGAIYVPPTTVDVSGKLDEPSRLSVDLVQAILTLGSQVPTDTQLVYDSQYGLGWEDPLGWEVYFGLQTSDMEQRLVVYQGVVNYLTDHGLQPELVSVEFIHAPYYRMER